MPKTEYIVINTSPLIALTAAWGNLEPLSGLYSDVLVPFEVCQEIRKGGVQSFAVSEFEQATWLSKQEYPLNISKLLLNSLDLGEASVIQLAIDRSIAVVCIDELVGRRLARLHGLNLTGSIGILLKFKQLNPSFSIKQAIQNMLDHKIRLSNTVIDFARKKANEE
ncbi:MAG: DUF3368 domain-containing protein [Pseudanabaena sp. ELA645]